MRSFELISRNLGAYEGLNMVLTSHYMGSRRGSYPILYNLEREYNLEKEKVYTKFESDISKLMGLMPILFPG